MALLAVLVAACEAPPPPPAAQFGSTVLEARRLADLMILGQPLPVDERTALRLAEHWVEASALSRAVREGQDLDSPASIEAATRWLAEGRVRELLLDELVPAEVIDPATAEDVYQQGELRLVAHILRAVSPAATQTERNRQRSTARQILEFLRSGGPWDEAVQGSEDPASAELNGLMGLYAAGELEGILDRQLFSLAPGAISGIVPSEGGFHILYRPAFEDVRTLFASYLQARRTQQRKLAVADSLRDAAGATLVADAAARLSTVALAPFGFMTDTTTLVVFRTPGAGVPSVTTSHMAERVARLSGDARRRLAEAPTEDRETVLMAAASEAATLRAAREQNIAVSAQDVEALRTAFQAELENALTSLGTASAGDGDLPHSDPVVDAYFEAFMARRVDQMNTPVGLLGPLLSNAEWSVSDAGIAEAVALAQRSLDALGDRR